MVAVAAIPTEGRPLNTAGTEKEEGVTAWGCIARAGFLGRPCRCCGDIGAEAGSLRTAGPSMLCPVLLGLGACPPCPGTGRRPQSCLSCPSFHPPFVLVLPQPLSGSSVSPQNENKLQGLGRRGGATREWTEQAHVAFTVGSLGDPSPGQLAPRTGRQEEKAVLLFIT